MCAGAGAQHGHGRRLRQTADIPVQFTPAAGRPQVYSVMDLCTSPCFGSDSGQSRCCPVPGDVAERFSCCRSSNCCPDNVQPNGHKRRLRAHTRRGHPRKMPGASGGASVSVEESSSNQNRFQRMMSCMDRPERLRPGDCGLGLTLGAAPTRSPTR